MKRLRCPRSPAPCVALLSSGGVPRKDQPPFDIRKEEEGGPPVPAWLREQGFPDAGDWSIRLIDADTPSNMLAVIHGKYNTGPANEDINVIFPIDRIRELAERALIGELAPHHIGMMGFIPDYTRVEDEVAPAVISRLKADRVDALLLSPG